MTKSQRQLEVMKSIERNSCSSVRILAAGIPAARRGVAINQHTTIDQLKEATMNQIQLSNPKNQYFIDNYATLQATAPMPGASQRYSFIPTTKIIEVMDKAGWQVHSVREATAREVARLGFQRHELRFMNETLPPIEVGNTFFQVSVINSHDRAAAIDIAAAIWRYTCRNGAKISEGTVGQIRIKHVGFAYDTVMRALDSMVERLPLIQGHIKEFKEIELTQDEQYAYALQAVKLRYDDDFLTTHRINYDDVLRVRRGSDQGNDLWKVFNRAQENLIGKGGVRMQQVTEAGEKYVRSEDPETGELKVKKLRRTSMRGVKSITEDDRLNKSLWALTEHMAAIKRGDVSLNN